jgi:hypothetical protein
VTYSPQNDVLVLGPRHLGVLPDTEVNFAGAANSPVDVTVEWSFHLKEPCGTPVDAAAADKATLKEMAGAFETTTGKLKTPTQLVLQKWINSCPGSQNWILTATSKQDRSRFSQYDLKFCRTKQDCPATTDTKPATPLAGIPAPVGGPPPTPAQPASAPGTPAATGKQESKKADDTKTKEAK